MRHRLSLAAVLSLGIVALPGTWTRPSAQVAPPFAVDQVLGFPFPEHLVASPVGATIAWTFNERGVRNIYVAEGPEFAPRKLTSYDTDDGQELTQLSFSGDGRHVVYVRGGSHDAAVGKEAAPPNPSGSFVEPKVQVWSVAVETGKTTLLGPGDGPVVAPKSSRVAFVKEGRIQVGPVDGSAPFESLFVQGTSRSLAWSPDGSTLAFESDRGGHSFIALVASGSQSVRYIAPFTARDSTPVWSPDSQQIAFVRQPGLVAQPLSGDPQPWALWVGDVAKGTARLVWKSGNALVHSLPTGLGGANLHWGGADRLVFLSFHDGFQHLYSVATTGGNPTTGGTPVLLTPGLFMVEGVSATPDHQLMVYNANRGAEPEDIDRRHIFKVPVGSAKPEALTTGKGIEWSPVVTGDGKTLAYFSADAQRPPLPTVQPLDGGPARVLAESRVPADFPAARLVTPTSTVIQSDGAKVRAQVFKTPDGDAVRPAIIFVHGGPAQQMLLGWHYLYYYTQAYALNQYLASRGFIVVSINYRLSIGYGHEFQNPDRAATSTAEYADVMAAATYLKSRSDVDPRRIGIWGGSYGGYLTALALGRDSDVFAAGVDIHGVHDSVAKQIEASITNTGGDEMGGEEFPWKSPVLLIHGDDDRTVPFQSTLTFEQWIVARGVPAEMRVIPDDVHEFLLFRSWKTVATETADFFDRQFFKKPGATPDKR